jgi:hypothetical protein
MRVFDPMRRKRISPRESKYAKLRRLMLSIRAAVFLSYKSRASM